MVPPIGLSSERVIGACGERLVYHVIIMCVFLGRMGLRSLLRRDISIYIYIHTYTAVFFNSDVKIMVLAKCIPFLLVSKFGPPKFREEKAKNSSEMPYKHLPEQIQEPSLLRDP